MWFYLHQICLEILSPYLLFFSVLLKGIWFFNVNSVSITRQLFEQKVKLVDTFIFLTGGKSSSAISRPFLLPCLSEADTQSKTLSYVESNIFLNFAM